MKPVSKLAAVLAVVIVAALGLFVVLYLRSRPAWYVEASHATAWERIVRQGNPPFTRVRLLNENAAFPQRPGFVISSVNAAVLPGDADGFSSENSPLGNSLIRYEQLSRTRECNGALLLALDPWLVFYKHGGSSLPYTRVKGPGSGTLILPGAETEALWAWTSQLMQRDGGIFIEDQKLWNETEQGIAAGAQFQSGAENCRWPEALSFVLRDGDAWIYAPLSRVLELPSYRSALLTARHFPVPSNWYQYGLQASLLWAIPAGTTGQRKKLAAAEAWLKDPQTQSLIAAELNWLPANPESSPANPQYRDAQLVWFSSSAVWQPNR